MKIKSLADDSRQRIVKAQLEQLELTDAISQHPSLPPLEGENDTAENSERVNEWVNTISQSNGIEEPPASYFAPQGSQEQHNHVSNVSSLSFALGVVPSFEIPVLYGDQTTLFGRTSFSGTNEPALPPTSEHLGPQRLLNTIIRFRQHKIAVSADIEGMFLQVGVLEQDQPSLRFLWREDPTFYAVLGNRPLTDEVLQTTFCMVEQILNSCPLTHVSDYPTEFEALTPSHFLLGNRATCFRSLSRDLDFDSRKRYARVQAYANAIWTRWLKEYVPSLNSRSKWHSTFGQLKTGDLV